MKILLQNGKLYDGTGAEPIMGDVLLDGDRIEAVGTALSPDGAEQVIDLKGLSVAPGFIDAHSHNDWFAIKKEPIPYFDPFIRQGITTFVAGNCGVSAIGFEPDSTYVDKLGAGLFSYADTTGKYGMPKEYNAAIDQNCPCNIATLVGIARPVQR